jgi:hypothetical protein
LLPFAQTDALAAANAGWMLAAATMNSDKKTIFLIIRPSEIALCMDGRIIAMGQTKTPLFENL